MTPSGTSSDPSGPPVNAATVGDVLQFVLGSTPPAPPTWPPDVFGVTTALLYRSGAYAHVLENWPPPDVADWTALARDVAQKWRQNIAQASPPDLFAVPPEIATWWTQLIGKSGTPLNQIRKDPDLCQTLIKLSTVSDEACWGFGLPASAQFVEAREKALRQPQPATSPPDDPTTAKVLARRVRRVFIRNEKRWGAASSDDAGFTLCRDIHPSRVRVLPKLHIPQSGFTIRSLSRNLALCTGDEVYPRWNLVEQGPGEESVNLLLIPWPNEICPSQFIGVAPGASAFRLMQGGHRFFEWSVGRDETAIPDVTSILHEAERVVGNITGVVLPELALTPAQYAIVMNTLSGRNCFLVSGICADKANYLQFEVPIEGTTKTYSIQQNKHHRWLVDKSQIVQYGLGSVLSPSRSWWEHIALSQRTLNFTAMRDWLTVAVLICEDLARPDPVGDLIRAVGPNLVIALLMDGPQLASRWAGRYATVLADDPGCSVLSLTSIGMCQLSRPPYVKGSSRVVALWKDAKSGIPVEIDLPAGASAIVLSLTVQYLDEWTADGRNDMGTTGYPILAGIHPIFPRDLRRT